MASESDVRQYLAYWFQAGKRVLLHSGKEAYRPKTVIQGDRYSDEFETCWSYLLSSDSGECYLEGTEQTIQELLSPSWDVNPCARCDMPVPMLSLGVASMGCPCSDLPSWPNQEVPQPRSPVNSQQRLGQIRDRLSGQSSNRN